uniref:Uncharacterized protein n=1 Tax=Amphimedon queenslandica TaxID=400682 RepID=A0A1X7SPM9_AMPQE
MLYSVLLLLLSGDIELNPGPRTGDPREILRAKSATLTDAISYNLEKVAVELNAKGLIPKQDTSTVGFDNYKKASILVGVLQTQLGCTKDPTQYLIDVCDVLLNNLVDKTLAGHAKDMLKELGISSGSTQQEQITKSTLATTCGGIEETDDPNGGATAAET